MTCEIPLTRGLVALVDDDDFDRVMSAGRWHAMASHNGLFYACRTVVREIDERSWVAGTCRVCGAKVNQAPVGRPRWYCDPHCRNMSRKAMMMHNFITGYPMSDHIDRNGLNNQRANLRPATNRQNSANTGPRSNNTSGFKGVWRYRDRWRAVVSRKHLGYFGSAEEAARAYDEAAASTFGEYAWLNFPAAS